MVLGAPECGAKMDKEFIFSFRFRLILYVVIGCLFLLDIYTTSLGLSHGGFESTPTMVEIVGNPILHLIVKTVALCLIVLVIEVPTYLVKRLNENDTRRPSFIIAYCFLIAGLIFIITLMTLIVINNISFMFYKESIV